MDKKTTQIDRACLENGVTYGKRRKAQIRSKSNHPPWQFCHHLEVFFFPRQVLTDVDTSSDKVRHATSRFRAQLMMNVWKCHWGAATTCGENEVEARKEDQSRPHGATDGAKPHQRATQLETEQSSSRSGGGCSRLRYDYRKIEEEKTTIAINGRCNVDTHCSTVCGYSWPIAAFCGPAVQSNETSILSMMSKTIT